MKTVFAVLVLVVAFTTGFTCSKNTPPVNPSEVPAVQPTPPTEMPADGGPSTATEGTTGTAATPPPETK